MGDLLKERLIGIQLFGRKPDYSTGEDPIVRVQAGDVRHRLKRYYADPECHSDILILIQIPLGSYSPVFHARDRVDDSANNGNSTARAHAVVDQSIEPGAVSAHRGLDMLQMQQGHGSTALPAEESPTSAPRAADDAARTHLQRIDSQLGHPYDLGSDRENRLRVQLRLTTILSIACLAISCCLSSTKLQIQL